MRERFQRVNDRVANALGLDVMGTKYQTLTYIYLFLMIFTTIESVFVNTLLHKISGDMTYVIIYRGISYLSSAIFMNVAAIVSQKSNPIFVLRLGSVFYLISYIGLVFGMNRMEQMRHIIPIFSGMAGAFYWSGHNYLVLEYSTQSNRDLGIGVFGIVQGITTLIIPVITGIIIARMPGNWGYQIMFAVGMLFVLVQVVFASRLAPVIKVNTRRKSQFRLALRLVRKKASFQLMLGYEGLRGMRDGVFAFILNMLLFEIIADEQLTGINTFLTGIMAIIGSWVYGKFVLPRLRAKYMVLSTTILLFFCGLLFFKMSVPTLMIFTTINAFFQLFLVNSNNNTSYDITAQSRSAQRCNREMYGLREITITTGRIIGLFAVYIMPKTQIGYVSIMCILTAAQYLTAFMIRKAAQMLEKKKAEVIEV